MKKIEEFFAKLAGRIVFWLVVLILIIVSIGLGVGITVLIIKAVMSI
jgi:hypothetical protein